MVRTWFLTAACVFANTGLSQTDPELIHTIEEIATPTGFIEGFVDRAKASADESAERSGLAVDVGTIINIGKEIWDIIVKNKPAADVQYQYANAIPNGVNQPLIEMQGFSPLTFKSYRLTGTTIFGLKAYEIDYTLVYRFGGSYQGQGAYLESVSFVPHRLKVHAFHNISFTVNKASAVNIGHSENPVAAMMLDVGLRVKGLFVEKHFRFLYEVHGDSGAIVYHELGQDPVEMPTE